MLNLSSILLSMMDWEWMCHLNYHARWVRTRFFSFLSILLYENFGLDGLSQSHGCVEVGPIRWVDYVVQLIPMQLYTEKKWFKMLHKTWIALSFHEDPFPLWPWGNKGLKE